MNQKSLENIYKKRERLKSITPPDFKLENYKGTAQLSAKEWLACLWHRFSGDVLENGKAMKPGLINWADPLNCSLPDELTKHSSDEISSVSYLDKDQLLIVANTPDTYAYLRVDLDMCDEILVKDFQDELKASRKHLDIEARTRSISNSEFRNWHEARILQYLDVCNWHAENGIKKVKNGELGAIIFSDITGNNSGDGALENKIRKTVEKHIKTVSSRKTIMSLFAQMHQSK